jgi:hypothetical protein
VSVRDRLHFFNPQLDAKAYVKGAGPGELQPASPESANLVSSLCEDGQHRPAIDIDLPCKLVESSTPGHFHLYIDHPLDWPQYVALLRAMAEAGIVDEKYLEHSLDRGQTLLRPPGQKKPLPAPRAFDDESVIAEDLVWP